MAESEGGPRLESTWVVRTGQRLQAPYSPTYRLVEYSQQRGRWIVPDFGYYDSGSFGYQLWFTGGGVEMHPAKRITWTQIVYAAQAAGHMSHGERSLFVWPVVDATITRRLTAETVFYPTIPLNRAQRWGFDLDRVKVEYRVRPNLVAGAGFSASTGAGMGWEKRPFATVTTLRGGRSMEFWGERIPGGAQLQVRYQLTRRGMF